LTETGHRAAAPSGPAPGSPAPEASAAEAGDLGLTGLLSAVAAAVPERTAVVAGGRRLSYAGLEHRAGLLARHLAAAGIRPGEHVALLSYNRAEWLESFFGVLGAGAVPVNVNYRYVAEELRYVLDDSRAVALIAERSLTPAVAGVRDRLPRLRHVLLLDDGAPCPAPGPLPGTDYEAALAGAAELPAPAAEPRGDALYLLYTGGTTGFPKGVMWRQEDIFHAALERRGPGAPRIRRAAEAGERALRCSAHRMLVLGPLMHAAGQWNALSMLFCGKTVLLNTDRVFDADRVAALADREGAQSVQLVGDAMARPLAQALLSGEHACADLRTVASGGTPLTPAVRALWRGWRPGITLRDSYGGSETGVCGAAAEGPGERRFAMGASVAVLDERMRPLPPGSESAGRIGRIARTGRIPLGYFNDPVKTERTFPRDPDGRRWVMSGDYGTVAGDGSIVLLGRGSAVINTGGEKVYPEEVESVLKAHPDVADTIVVPSPDELLGQRVTAVIAPVPGRSPSPERLREHCRTRLAGFKVPRAFRVVDRVRRTAVGKQDYRWAAAVARGAAPAEAREGAAAGR